MTASDGHWRQAHQATRLMHAAAGKAVVAASDVDFLTNRGQHAGDQVAQLVAAIHDTQAWCADVLADVGAAGYSTAYHREDRD